MAPKFRVGLAANPKDDDRTYDSIEAAIEAATLCVNTYRDSFTTPICIWDEKCNPVYLYMLGEQFKPV